MVVKYRGKNLDITKPRYSGHILLSCEPPGCSSAVSPAPPPERPGELGSQANILPVPWPFVISRFHCNFFVNVPGVLLGNFGGGVPAGSSNPGPISNQKNNTSHPFSDLASKKIMSSILTLEQQQKKIS